MFWYCCLLLSEYLGMVWVVGVLYVALASFKIAQTSLKRVKPCCGRFVRELVFGATSSYWHPSISFPGCSLVMAMALLGHWQCGLYNRGVS